jgi:hypothetical protein
MSRHIIQDKCTNATPKFEEQDLYNTWNAPLAGRGKPGNIFTGSLTPKGGAPTIQVSIFASHNCIIRIQQSSVRSSSNGYYRDFAADDIYEYTTPNKPIFIQRTLGFVNYRIVCENPNEEDMKSLYLTTQLVNHPAITQGIIL